MTFQLFAVTRSETRELRSDGTAAGVQELLERLPGGVYSALRTFDHDRFLWLDRHLERTERSMAGLGWPKELDRALVARALAETARAYPLADSRIRFDVLREAASLQGVTSDLFLSLAPFVPVPEKFVREGVRVEFAPHLHRDVPRIKTTDFIRARKPFPIGTQERYEHLMVDESSRILECSSANISFVRGSELVTAGDGVLEGITFAVLRHLAPSVGLRVREERLAVSDLARVDEAFVSSSTRGVVPVIQVGDQPIGDGRVGAHTRALSESYLAFAAREARPASA